MKKLKLNLSKLTLNKEKIVSLTNNEALQIKGGEQISRDSCNNVCNGPLEPTRGSIWCNPRPTW
jgi:hypothetical protein